MRFFKRYFVTGLLIWIPLIATFWVLAMLVETFEGLVPAFLSSQALFGMHIPGFQFGLVLAVILLTGVLCANFIGRALLDRWERLLGRIPLVRSIYNAVKQVSDTMFAPNGQAFREAVLVEYPRKGLWTIGFLTGVPCDEVEAILGDDHVSIYVPTTPNPTSGFFLMLPRADVRVLEMPVEDLDSAAAAPSAPEAPEGLEPPRKSVAYQPVPLRRNPAAVTCFS